MPGLRENVFNQRLSPLSTGGTNSGKKNLYICSLWGDIRFLTWANFSLDNIERKFNCHEGIHQFFFHFIQNLMVYLKWIIKWIGCILDADWSTEHSSRVKIHHIFTAMTIKLQLMCISLHSTHSRQKPILHNYNQRMALHSFSLFMKGFSKNIQFIKK